MEKTDEHGSPYTPSFHHPIPSNPSVSELKSEQYTPSYTMDGRKMHQKRNG